MLSPAIRPILLVISLLGLSACERETYTSWSCNSASETKLPMVLKQARMEFQGMKFDYCGSLGNLSYFDQQCPGVTQESRVVFNPASGVLLNQAQQYQCTAL